MFELRDYQREAVAAVKEAWSDGERPLLCMATGTGKTVVMSQLASDAVGDGGRVLLLAHRGELLDQATRTISAATGISVGREQAGYPEPTADNSVVVGSIQSVVRDKRLERVSADGYTHVFIDEAHHSRSATYETVLGAFEGCHLLGVTATPDRGDQRALGTVYTKMAYRYDLADAVRDENLCPIKALMVPLQIDLTKVRVQNGDYVASDTGAALDPYLPEIASAMVDQGCGTDRKTVVFCPLVTTAEKVAAELRRWGIDAECVSGQSPDRKEVLGRFAARSGGVLCNSMLLTEGWDCPDVSCVVVLRPTKSRSLFCQMVGRGTRLCPDRGKEDLLLVDFLWQTEGHDLCRPSCLLAKDKEIARRIDEKSKDGAVDLVDAERDAEASAAAQREANLAERLEEMRRSKRKKELVDPLQWAASIGSYELLNYTPVFAWERKPPTDKQIDGLERLGIYAGEIETRGHASKMMSVMSERINKGLATAKQVRFLERKGFVHCAQWTKDEASMVIGRIADNHWFVPRDLGRPSGYRPPSLAGAGEAK